MSARFAGSPDAKADSSGDMAGVKRALFEDAKALTNVF